MHKTDNKTYPFNLIRKIYGVVINDKIVNAVYYNGLFEQLEKFDKTTQRYITLRFKKNLIRDKCAEILGMSVNQLAQLELDILDTLRQPNVRRLYEGCERFKLDNLKRVHKFTQDENDEIRDLLIKVKNGTIEPVDINLDNLGKTSSPKIDILVNSIDSLNLNRRAYNSLRQNKYHTVGDITEASVGELRALSGMGQVSLSSVLSELEKIGLSPRDKPMKK